MFTNYAFVFNSTQKKVGWEMAVMLMSQYPEIYISA